MSAQLPETWQNFLTGAGVSPEIWQKPLTASVERRKTHTVYPPADKVFTAFALTPPESVRVVLLGQDPYHDENQAEGLAFSVSENVPLPPSLKNIFTEYSRDLDRNYPDSGTLRAWASGGVLLLNTILTVDAHQPGSHKNFGWEKFTDAVISALNRQKNAIVFILWGNFAIKKSRLITSDKHTVISGAHPSPLSAYRGFFGSAPFSNAEKALGSWSWPEL
ncbi:MAG: uracil-DNA glycosylase [Lentisphaeria bacterium]|nr:uracil-DNA glycosylase [Lentisphaeria bacterium]